MVLSTGPIIPIGLGRSTEKLTPARSPDVRPACARSESAPRSFKTTYRTLSLLRVMSARDSSPATTICLTLPLCTSPASHDSDCLRAADDWAWRASEVAKTATKSTTTQEPPRRFGLMFIMPTGNYSAAEALLPGWRPADPAFPALFGSTPRGTSMWHKQLCPNGFRNGSGCSNHVSSHLCTHDVSAQRLYRQVHSARCRREPSLRPPECPVVRRSPGPGHY